MTLAGTNVIESAFSIVETVCRNVKTVCRNVKTVCRNVKRWHGGDQRERWIGSGLLIAEKQFRRVRGFRELPLLAAALRRAVGLPEREEVAIA